MPSCKLVTLECHHVGIYLVTEMSIKVDLGWKDT